MNLSAAMFAVAFIFFGILWQKGFFERVIPNKNKIHRNIAIGHYVLAALILINFFASPFLVE